jgi:hypothetical protein
MLKATVAILPGINATAVKQKLRFSGNRLTVASPIASLHALALFNAQGKCVARIQNPFASRTVCAVTGLSKAFYVARLELSENRKIEAEGF